MQILQKEITEEIKNKILLRIEKTIFKFIQNLLEVSFDGAAMVLKRDPNIKAEFSEIQRILGIYKDYIQSQFMISAEELIQNLKKEF